MNPWDIQKMKGKAIVHELTSVDVKNIHAKVEMSQNQFASLFGISVSTPQHWERSDRTLHGPALLLLNVVAKTALKELSK